ncbi:MAG: hypothetical protein ACPH3D_06100, partial [Porticoccaceae bacterium]
MSKLLDHHKIVACAISRTEGVDSRRSSDTNKKPRLAAGFYYLAPVAGLMIPAYGLISLSVFLILKRV